MKRRALVAGVAILGSGCSFGPKQPAPAVYDLGPAAAQPSVIALRVSETTAPPWLDGTGIAYRLDYRDAYRREIYRDSRWAAPPAALVTQRLRQRFLGPAGGSSASDAASADPLAGATLQLHLDEFTQVYATPSRSQALVRVRTTLDRAGIATAGRQRAFVIEHDAASADAAGAVRALAAAVDELLDQVQAWVLA